MNKTIIIALLAAVLTPPCAAHDIVPKENNSIRIMSYNVHNFVGMDNIRDYQRIADVINDVAPDVVAIQEADSVTRRSEGIYTLQKIASLTLMFPTYAPAIEYQGGKYGIGILSKEKPLSVKQIPLPGREEKRTLLIVEFNKYYLACTHLSLNAEDRVASANIINDAMKGVTKPLFLAGDMNSEPESLPQATINQAFNVLSDVKKNTIPVVNPTECIDYIYQYRNGQEATALRRQVINEQMASDHLPLYVDVRIKAKASEIFRTKPFLQNPIGDGITISWFTTVPTHSWIEYGTDENNLAKRIEPIADGQVICNNTHHKIRLNDLTPGTTYYYRVCSREITLYQAYRKEFGETVRSNTYSFTLPTSKTTDFTAVIFNDLHKNKQVLDLLAQQIKNTKYDMIFFNGDCIDDPANENEALNFLSYMCDKTNAQSIPFFFLRGNHEIRNAYSIQLRELIDYAGGANTFGSFNWGNTRFVLLDCGEDKPDTTYVYYNLNNFDAMREQQTQFLKAELHDKAFLKANKKILIHHIPTYGIGNDYNPCLQLWGPILSKAPFDVCINGHTHAYAYYPKGKIGNNYPVVIGGGNRIETATVMILCKKNDQLTLQVLDTQGNKLLTFNNDSK